MCGIAGILAAEPPEVLGADVRRMVETLRHRGPDDLGVEAGAGWSLGMSRLAVQDPSSAGHQPMSAHGLTVVFNGEIYNFPTLREELVRHGYSFVSACDTEVVLAAFAEWGTAAFARFNGMFAIAIVDEASRTLTLARDRFGKKPLFVARDAGGRTLFASELKAVMAVMRRRPAIDRRALAEFFQLQYVPSPRCILDGAEKLPAACWRTISLEGGRVHQERLWTLPEPTSDAPPATPEEVLEAIRRAVALRLVADVPVGCFLSGGTDSSLVSACMAQAVPGARTFSIGFSDPRFDESRYALEVAARIGTDHTHHVLEAGELIEFLPAFAHAYDEPFADSSAIPTMAVARLARSKVTVALSGDGGDEFFGGYTRYRLGRVIGLAAAVPRSSGRAFARLVDAPLGLDAVGRFGQLAAGRSAGEAYQSLVSVWRPDDLRRLMPDVDADGFVARAFDSAPGHLLARMMRADASTYLIDDILQKVDRATMATSLEARNPLLDPEVVELGLRSEAIARRDPGGKPLLRQALRLLLPRELVERPKMGFGVPVGEWMRGPLRPLVEDVVMSASATEYDVKTAHAVAHSHLAGHEAAPQLWSLLVLELWRRTWLDAPRPVPS